MTNKANRLIKRNMQEVWSLSQKKECIVTSLFFWISIHCILVSSDNIMCALVFLTDPEFLCQNIINLINLKKT